MSTLIQNDRPTLTLSDPSEGLSVTIQADRSEVESPALRPDSGRWQFSYRIELADDGPAIEGQDLRSGTVTLDGAPDLADGMRSLLSFVSAADPHSGADCWAEGDRERLAQVAEVADLLAEYLGAQR